ncbi:MAG: Gamma-glutamylputrescine oxidoreductase [Alphaproteobacteria bacterium MarineAlpha5_Bin9]|nr:MAG: Gamma-glutamylputrescine oxidoreductase [Alphaproteobacteria bacterium MarineAlpha5_Bin9]|tara:strand:- start:3605 stop:4942 length:1338 start_codon:yes stop_codon:yes gene_type:complete
MSNLYHSDMYNFKEPVKSYWENTYNLKNQYKKVESNIKTDVVIIGGGYTGISCALNLSKNFNIDVVLLEAGHIGWGSSARNAGFCCIPPAKMSVEKMFKKFGEKETKKFFKNTIEGSNYTKNLITEYNIDCDLTGECNYEVAPHPSYFKSIQKEAEIYKTQFGIETEIFSKEEFNQIGHTGKEQYGAMSYKPGFAINPLKFLLGLSKKAQFYGVKIFQNSKVEKIKKISNKFNIFVNGYNISSNKIVLATNGFYKDDLIPHLNDRILPVISNIIVTRPLTNDEIQSHNFSTHNPILNVRNLLFYYRLLKDKRFLFGARGDLLGSNKSSKIMAQKMEMQIKKIFPNWNKLKIEFYWRGFVAVTTKLTPSIGKIKNEEIYYSFGYHANGVNTAPWAGKELSKIINGSNSKDLLISKLYLGLPKKFIFSTLRLFYLRLAYIYYSIIDR